MSYLDLPRINFGGSFQASPATVNNTPNNYKPENYNEDTFKPEKIEVYWEPKGDSIFDLIKCKVTTVDDASGARDALVDSSVSALYTGAPPKLVDLDPMQQNVSEIWGMTVMVGSFGGASVRGTFTPVAFNGIWQNSQGPNTPRNSASGSAIYVSTLTNLQWSVGESKVLQTLEQRSPDRLSIRFVVSAHNNAPQTYAFTAPYFDKMKAQGVPTEVVAKLAILSTYSMNHNPDGTPKSPGLLPTQAYVNYLFDQLLSPDEVTQWGPTILTITKQPYQPWIDNTTNEPLGEQPRFDFNYGKIVGSIGPCAADEPSLVVPARTLAQANPATTPACWWAAAQLDVDAPRLTLDLANSLPVPLPGRPLWKDQLGTLSLAYYTVSETGAKTYTTFCDAIDYANPDFIDKQSGLLVVDKFEVGGKPFDAKRLASLPIALRSTVNGTTKTLLEECPSGLSMRANQFVFRMNPGMTTTQSFPRGEQQTADIYVRKFGRVEGTEGLSLSLKVLSAKDAVAYTTATMGTGGTLGIDANNTSTPEGKLGVPGTVAVHDGKASLVLTGTDPGGPAQTGRYADGQVYFATYEFSDPVEGYNQDPNDLLSAQIYQQTPITGTPTWANGIGEILRQYGMLYPVMGRFELWTYQGVKANYEKIARVLGLDMSQPLHMPVSRDMSDIRKQLILDWIKAGMPES